MMNNWVCRNCQVKWQLRGDRDPIVKREQNHSLHPCGVCGLDFGNFMFDLLDDGSANLFRMRRDDEARAAKAEEVKT